MKAQPRISILLYARQPLIALGLAVVLKDSTDLQLLIPCDHLAEAIDRLRSCTPNILLVHLPARPSLSELARLHSANPECPIVLWGDDPGGDFAFQAMHLGVRAFLPDDSPVANLLSTIMTVHGGVLCFEKHFVEKVMSQQRITLTRREGQLAWLVAQGFRNKAIGARLGITEGTVKVYIYKLFKKLGVNDRLQMALYVLRNLGGPASGGLEFSFNPHSLPAQSRAEVLPIRIN